MANQLNGQDYLYYLDSENFYNLRADLVEYTPSGALASSTVQDALDEVASLAISAGNDELLQELQFAQLSRFVEFVYSGSDLVQKNIWNEPAKITKLFQVDYTYTAGDLTQIDVERISDSAVYTKVLSYVSGDLVSIEVS